MLIALTKKGGVNLDETVGQIYSADQNRDFFVGDPHDIASGKDYSLSRTMLLLERLNAKKSNITF